MASDTVTAKKDFIYLTQMTLFSMSNNKKSANKVTPIFFLTGNQINL